MKTSLRNILTTSVALGVAAAWAAEPTKLPKLIDLGADKCIPCKAMAPDPEGPEGGVRGPDGRGVH